MNYRKSFLIIIALFVGFSSGARAGFSLDTLWIKHYPYSVNKSLPIPGTDRAYGFIYSYDDNITRGLVEFSDINGDSIRKLNNVWELFFAPIIILKDTNFIIGNSGNQNAKIFDVKKGESKLIRIKNDRVVGYLPESNNVVLRAPGGTIIIFNLDSNNEVNYAKIPTGWMSFLPGGNHYLSPKGTYVCSLSEGPNFFDETLTCSRNYILNTSDLSFRAVLSDTCISHYSALHDSINYKDGLFNDDESLLALMTGNRKYIDLYDLNSNHIIKRIDLNMTFYMVPFIFDSTGKYLMFGGNDYTFIYNTETYQVDYMTDKFPNMERITFTNILCNGATKIHIRDLASGINDETDYQFNVIYSTQGINITSNNLTTISSIKIFDVNANNIYTSGTQLHTPVEVNVNLNTGVYFIIIEINGKNEYHKIIVQ